MQALCGIHVDSPPVIPALTTSYAHGTSSTPFLHATVGEILQQTVERWPDREAMAFLQDGVRKTFAQFQQEVSLNPAYQAREVEFALQKVGCKAVVCPTQFKTQKYCDMLRQICPEIESSSPGGIKSSRLPELTSVIVIDIRQPGMFHLDDVMQAGSSQYKQQLQDLQRKLSCDDPINIQFTSGTTGAPKGATLSHHNIVNNAYYVGNRIGYPWRPHPRICLPVPLYHCFGSVGGGILHSDAFLPLSSFSNYRCTVIYGTPTMFVDMLNQPDLAKYDLSSVEAGIMAGSPCPPEVVRKVIQTMGVKGLTIGYGTTENSPVTFFGNPTDNMERKSETVGYIMDHLEAKIVNPTSGEIVPLGETGEIMIRGYCVMLGYWNDESKTSECITKDGWYKTGDIGSMDACSYCRIEGRIKDMIIRGGENIYPAEIEQFLHTHPKVVEAQVVGVKDDRMGEEICACIKLVEGQDCTEEEIKAFCKGKIAHFKIPRYILFVNSYPLTVTAKQRIRETTQTSLSILYRLPFND
uniref:Medium-chain acyl-CoA ligase ACSF2, mitochondrial n=1 Tax=Myripristis murdjan TaxID=586833 RepID=A0A667X8H1_9TELE